MSLTKKQKIRAYKNVLKALDNKIIFKNDNRPYYKLPNNKNVKGLGVCQLLDTYVCNIIYKIEPYLGNIKLKELFPELYKYEKNIPFWLKTTQNRKKVIKQILSNLNQ